MAHGEIYVQLSVTYADDPKVRALARYGRDARRLRDLYVQMLCYCKANLTDGEVPAEQIGVLVYPDPPATGLKDAARLAEVGLIEARGRSWFVPGFLKRNKSRAAIETRAEEKRRAAAKANHVRWHVERTDPRPDCEWCRTDPKPDRKSDPKPIPSGVRTDSSTDSTEVIGHRSEDIGQSHRSVPSDPTPSSPPPPDDDPTPTIEDRIIQLLDELTGRTVDHAWATRIRHQLLDDRDITNPHAYIAAAIRGEPTRYLPPPADDPQGAQAIAHVKNTDPEAAARAARQGAHQARQLLAQRPTTADGGQP